MTRVQIPFWPLAGVVVLGKCLVQLLGHPYVNSQLVCLPLVVCLFELFVSWDLSGVSVTRLDS